MLGNGHSLIIGNTSNEGNSGAAINTFGSATLNLGSGSNRAQSDLYFTVLNHSGTLLASVNTSVINIYDGVIMGDIYSNSSTPGIFVSVSSIVNMYGGVLDNCYLTSNTALSAGVHVVSNATFNMYGGTISNCYGYGGGAVILASNGKFNMNGGTITGCYSAYNGGGAVYINSAGSAQFVMNGGTIEDCHTCGYAYNNPWTGDAINLSSSNYFGGAIFSLTYAEGVVINGGTITENTASVGGAIFIYQGKVIINGGEITNNTANAQGGGLVLYTGVTNATVRNAIITGNKSKNNSGGGIFAQKSSLILIENCTITNNSATNGGGIYFSSTPSVSIVGSLISGNTTTTSGGGIYKTGTGELTISDTEIAENSAPGSYGGGIYAGGGTITLNDVNIHDNTTNLYGGGIAIASATVTLNSGIIANNISNQRGGGISIPGAGKLIVNGGSITQNFANNMGGGVNTSGSGSSVEINGGSITANWVNLENTSGRGGGLYIASVSTLTMTGGSISGNAAYLGGGLISLGNTVIGDDAIIYNNNAVVGGDDIVFSPNSTTLTLGACCNEEIMGCHETTDWYTDEPNERWLCYVAPGSTKNSTLSAGTYSDELYIKAAHPSSEAYSYNAPGRRLDKLSLSEAGTIEQNGAISAYIDIERTSANWYIGATQELPQGTIITLIYYYGTAIEHYYLVLSSDSACISLQDFTIMGDNTKFARSDSEEHFTCQLCFVFPENNTLDDNTYVWLADSEYAEYFANITAFNIAFSGSSIAPSANVSISAVVGDADKITATVIVSDLSPLERTNSDSDRLTEAALSDYRAVLVVELLDEDENKVNIPYYTAVKIGDETAVTAMGFAVVEIHSNGDYEIFITNLDMGSYKITTHVCFVVDEFIYNPMNLILASATSAVVEIEDRSEFVISANLVDCDKVLLKSAIDENGKELTFNVGYLPANSTNDIIVKTYIKENGEYNTETGWTYVVSDKLEGVAKVAVTVPYDVKAEGVGTTYRIDFIIGSAVYQYNIIVVSMPD